MALTACSGAAQSGSTSKAEQASTNANVNATAAVGRAAPDWSEPIAPSGSLSLASLRGKAVYLNFFATWCPPCNEEAPAVNQLQKQFASKGLQVVGIDVLENEAKADRFRTDHHLVYPAVVDDGTLRDQYNINGLPVHVFIDRQGIVRNIVVGELAPAEIRADVIKLLANRYE